MKAILRYVALPFFAFCAAVVIIKFAWDYSPILVLSVFGGLFMFALVRGYFIKRADLKRGWRVGHAGRDQMFYEELVEGSWKRIPIDGEMLIGDAHHVIYFPSRKEWEAMPEWTRGRRKEIVTRIKERFTAPGYEYEDAEQIVAANRLPAES